MFLCRWRLCSYPSTSTYKALLKWKPFTHNMIELMFRIHTYGTVFTTHQNIIFIDINTYKVGMVNMANVILSTYCVIYIPQLGCAVQRIDRTSLSLTKITVVTVLEWPFTSKYGEDKFRVSYTKYFPSAVPKAIWFRSKGLLRTPHTLASLL